MCLNVPLGIQCCSLQLQAISGSLIAQSVYLLGKNVDICALYVLFLRASFISLKAQPVSANNMLDMLYFVTNAQIKQGSLCELSLGWARSPRTGGCGGK